MGHWNYRLWKITGENEDWLELRETYYNDAGEICACTERAADMVFYEMNDALEIIDRMRTDFEKCQNDILNYEKFKFAEWDK